MVDLKSQYERIREETDRAIREVIDSTAFINGQDVKLFQQELADYLGIRYVIPCANGTDALQVALMSLGLEPGDEVITTPFSFISTIEVIKLLGLTPVLADIDPDTFNINVREVELALTKNTRAVIPVHLFGQCAEMNTLLELARENQLAVIEDAAQALGTEYIFPGKERKMAGTLGDIGCTSFFPSKNLGCWGDGGAIYTDDSRLASLARSIVNHGMREKYHYDHVGINSRLDSLQAAILRVKLRYLGEYIRRRQEAAGFYDRAFADFPQIKTPAATHYSSHTYNQYTITLYGVNRNRLREYLMERHIPAMIYYPRPLHLQEAYRDLNYKEGDFPVAEELCPNVLSLPMHTELTGEQLHHITGTIREFVTKYTSVHHE